MTSEHEAAAFDPKKRQRRKKKNNRFMRNAKGFAKQGIFGRGTHIDDDQYQYFINILDAMKAGFDDAEEKVNMANNVFETTKTQEIHLASNQIVCKALESLVGYVDAENLERYFEVFADSFRPICSDRFASHVLQKMVEIAFLRAVGKDSLKQEDAAAAEPTAAKRAKPDLLSEETYNLETDFGVEHKQNCGAFVLRVSKFLLNNLEDFVWDSCASHIMRTCILSLAGVHVPKVAFEKGGAEMAKQRKLYEVPEEKEWQETMLEFARRLEMWPQFSDLPYEELTSPLLSVICVALRVTDKNALKHFGKKILMEALLKVDVDAEDKDKKIEILDDDDEQQVQKMEQENDAVETTDDKAPDSAENASKIKLPKVFEYQTAIILLETLLTVAGPKLLTQLYAMLFTGRVRPLALEPLTNFAVQKLLHNIKEKEDFESIFAELAPHTEALLKCGHTGVVQALTAACLRLGTKQSQMIVALQTALHVAGDKEKSRAFFQCLVKLKPYDVMKADTSAFVHLHGSLIIQHVLHFNKPIFLVTCIVETPADQLATVFNTPNGSHIADAFVQSKFIGEKSREKLIRHLEGFYLDLAMTRFGSRVVENIFAAAAQEAQQSRIVKELADKVNMLKSTPFGRLLYNKFRVETYRLSASQWRASLAAGGVQKTTEQKATKLFKDIVN